MIPKREGFKGELFMGINPTHIPEIIIIVYNLLLFVECSQSQSLNSCKRVGVSE
jgi:hypothetical protein